jgi:hypothetical protein
MKRALITLALCIALVGCQMSCASFKAAETSGKTDAAINYYESWLVGAQLLMPMFGSYAPAAQVAINSAYTALELYRRASDMLTAGKLDAAQVAQSLTQLQNQIIEIKSIGNQAGIGK